MLQQSKKIRKYQDNNQNKKENYQRQNIGEFDSEIYQEFSEFDFDELAIFFDPLEQYVYINNGGFTTIDWKNPDALKTLTQAILIVKFELKYWDIPNMSLCPTVPSRLNYLQWIKQSFLENILTDEQNQDNKDLLKILQNQEKQIKGIDIGTGSNLIYALLGVKKYNWHMTATEIEENSYNNAKIIIEKNDLEHSIHLIHNIKKNKDKQFTIFEEVIDKNQYYMFSLCNPPYFSQKQDRNVFNNQFVKNQNMEENEFVTKGGEVQFLKQMIQESKNFANNILIFTSLVGVKQHYFQIKDYLKQEQQNQQIAQFFTARFKQGKNFRWGVAWTFFKDLKFHNLGKFIDEEELRTFQNNMNEKMETGLENFNNLNQQNQQQKKIKL